MKTISFSDNALGEFRNRYAGTVVDHLLIELVAVHDGSLIAEMPVTSRALNSQGFLHGGVSLLLAETVASFASLCLIADQPSKAAAGMSVAGSHMRPAEEGDRLVAETRPLHVGRRSHVWITTIRNQHGKSVSVVQTTVAIVDRRPEGDSPIAVEERP